jgi:hypothetical protein
MLRWLERQPWRRAVEEARERQAREEAERKAEEEPTQVDQAAGRNFKWLGVVTIVCGILAMMTPLVGGLSVAVPIVNSSAQ